MLVLARKTKQSLRIGDDIVITILGIQGDQVRLGITAPRDIQVLRQELYEEVSEANTQAAQTIHTADISVLLNQIQIIDKNARNSEKK